MTTATASQLPTIVIVDDDEGHRERPVAVVQLPGGRHDLGLLVVHRLAVLDAQVPPGLVRVLGRRLQVDDPLALAPGLVEEPTDRPDLALGQQLRRLRGDVGRVVGEDAEIEVKPSEDQKLTEKK